MQVITSSPLSTNKVNYNHSKNVGVTPKSKEHNYTASGASILANQNIAFTSVRKDLHYNLPYDIDLIADIRAGQQYYYLKNNPEEFYLKYRRKINNFLRTYTLSPVPKFIDIAKNDRLLGLKNLKYIQTAKNENLAIVETPKKLDMFMKENKTKEPMVMYTYAPSNWLDNAENGSVKEKAYLFATDKKDNSFEKIDICGEELCPEFFYEEPYENKYVDFDDEKWYAVLIPENTPYMEIPYNDHTERGMLFPRDMEYKIIDKNSVEMVPKNYFPF